MKTELRKCNHCPRMILRYTSTGGRNPLCPACNAKVARDYRKKVRAETFAAYGGAVCKCCGETEEWFLTLDHINNQGNAHRELLAERKSWKNPRKIGGYALYAELRAAGFPPGFQVLCMNCNWGKKVLGVCPHQLTQTERPADPYRQSKLLELSEKGGSALVAS